MEKTKYNTGKLLDYYSLKEEEKSLAISEWSEGNESLRKAIYSCIENGIPTYASCKGHGIFESPYLAMVITKENKDRILNIINELGKQRSTDLLLAYGNRASYDGELDSILSVYANMINREKVFKTIEEAACEKINQEEMPDELQAFWNFHQTLKTHGNGFFHNLYLRKGLISKEIRLDRVEDSASLVQLLDKNLGKRKNNYGYIIKGNFTDKLDKLSEEIDDYFVKVTEKGKTNEESKTNKVKKELFPEKYIVNTANIENISNNENITIEPQIDKDECEK